MRFVNTKYAILIASALWISHASNPDPCTELCRVDGPSICTGGSWNKNGVCHGYHFVGSPAEGRCCYHNSVTASWCSSHAPAVRPADVPRLIALRRSTTTTTTVERTTTKATPTTTTTVEPTTSSTTATTSAVTIPGEMFFEGNEEEFEAFIAGLRVSSTTTTGASDIPPIGDGDLIAPPSTALGHRDQLVREIVATYSGRMWYQQVARLRAALKQFLSHRSDEDRRNPLAAWIAVRGHVLLHRLNNHVDSLNDGLGIVAALTLGMNMVDSELVGDHFARESGIRAFCEQNRERVSAALIDDRTQNWKSTRVIVRDQAMQFTAQVATYAANIDVFCPSLLTGPSGPELTLIMLEHRAYRSVAVPVGNYFTQFSLIATRRDAFISAMAGGNGLVGNDRVALTLPWARVVFDGEHASGVGLINDWFSEAVRQVTDPDSELLDRHESGIYAIRPANIDPDMIEVYSVLYRAMGRFIALAIVHGRPLGLRLSAAVYGHILNQNPTLADMELEEPELARSLRLMLAADAEELDLYPLEINGEQVELTIANREELVGRKLRSMVANGAQEQLAWLVEGFHDILPLNLLTGVTIGNLGAVLYGNPRIDVEDLISSLELNGYNREDVQIQWLFETLRSYSNEQLGEFLKFATGTRIAPLGGFRSLNPRISIRVLEDVRRYPKSQTCFHAIYLPQYSTKATLQERLGEAFANNGALQD